MATRGHTMAGDEILKNSFANFAFENFEMAAYNSVITVAEHGGYAGAVQGLEANLREEKLMAAWLDESISAVTAKFVSLKERGDTARI